MKAFSKWTKWQIGLVIAIMVVYLFQEVKDSPEFLNAVREAAASKLNKAPKVSLNPTESSRKTWNASGGSISTAQPHTRSRAS